MLGHATLTVIEHATTSDVVVQALVTMGAIAVVFIPLWYDTRRKVNKVHQSVGTPNGHGPVLDILGSMLKWQVEHDVKDDKTRDEVQDIKRHLGMEVNNEEESAGHLGADGMDGG